MTQRSHTQQGAGPVVLTHAGPNPTRRAATRSSWQELATYTAVLTASVSPPAAIRLSITCAACPATSPTATMTPSVSNGQAPAVHTTFAGASATPAQAWSTCSVRL